MRRINLGSILNMRDLGGYPTVDGKVTKWGGFYRSAMPSGLTEADLAAAKRLNISTAIDLRSRGELSRESCSFNTDGFDYINIDLAGEQLRDMMSSADSIPAGYFAVIKNGSAFADVIHAIASADGAVLFHCTAGKDRTGITAAVLLMLAGVEDPDIVADYQVTHTYLRPLFQKLDEEYPDMPLHLKASEPAYMWGFLELFHAEYKSAEDYLRGIGVSDDEIATIRGRLV